MGKLLCSWEPPGTWDKEENGQFASIAAFTYISLPILLKATRAEGLLFLHGLESNPGSSLQTEEEAGLP